MWGGGGGLGGVGGGGGEEREEEEINIDLMGWQTKATHRVLLIIKWC